MAFKLAVSIMLSLSILSNAQNTAEMLGYDSESKLLIINADDFGMSHAENAATMDLLKNNHVTSATIMMPCPWVKEVAQFCNENPGLDIGVHLTFTSEWKRYKWGSVASHDRVPSLLTELGYFPEDSYTVEKNASADEVELEMRAQLDFAKKLGLELTHFDNHMGSLYGLATGRHFFESIFKLSAEYGLPFRLPRNISKRYRDTLAPSAVSSLEQIIADLVSKGYVLPDYLVSIQHGKSYQESFDIYAELLKNLKPGVTELYIHAALPTEEIKSISAAWRNRDHDYRIFKSDDIKELYSKYNIKLIQWKELQKLQQKNMAQ